MKLLELLDTEMKVKKLKRIEDADKETKFKVILKEVPSNVTPAFRAEVANVTITSESPSIFSEFPKNETVTLKILKGSQQKLEDDDEPSLLGNKPKRIVDVVVSRGANGDFHIDLMDLEKLCPDLQPDKQIKLTLGVF